MAQKRVFMFKWKYRLRKGSKAIETGDCSIKKMVFPISVNEALKGSCLLNMFARFLVDFI